MARRRKRKGLPMVLLVAIVGMIAINGYAYRELMSIAQGWRMSLLPGSIARALTRLAVILAINSAVILYLLITRRR